MFDNNHPINYADLNNHLLEHTIMNGFSKLNQNKFVQTLFDDELKALSGINVSPSAIFLPDDVELDEHQYYVHKVGFCLVHTLAWCKQLDFAIEFLSNFDYAKKIDASRADHLIYNVENYLIRLNSVYERVLQLVNAVFHLCINEENVGHAVVISNHKVQHRPEIVLKVKAVQKYLKDYSQARHTLIHKHSWQDVDLRRIELFYLHDVNDLHQDEKWRNKLKTFRAKFLRDYITEKKIEFAKINSELAILIDNLFLALLDEYERQCKGLK